MHKNTKIMSASDLSGSSFSSSIFAKSDVESVTLADGLLYVIGGVFKDAEKLTSIVIPDGVKRLDTEIFSGCKALTSVNLGKVESIGDRAFAGTEALESIVIPSTVTTMGATVFDNASGIKEVVCEAEHKPAAWDVQWIYDITLATFGK